MKCPHQFRVISTEITGQRKVYYLQCSLCPATKLRNRTLKRFQAPHDSGQPKPAKTSQKGLKRQRKAIPKVSAEKKRWNRLYEEKCGNDPAAGVVWGIARRGGDEVDIWSAHGFLVRMERHHPLGRLGARILFYQHVTPALHDWIHSNAKRARELGLILPEMSGRQSQPGQPDPFRILPAYHAYLNEHGLKR